MNSSIFSSEGVDNAPYRRWIVRFVVALTCGLVLAYAGVLLCDPYSTGRFSRFSGIDIAISTRALANIGRLRDPQFDSAIISNSHGFNLDPVRLGVLTGNHLVQLAILAIGPDAELAIATAFARERQGSPAALVWVLDDGWCAKDGEFVHDYDHFPFWLYGTSELEYLRHVFSIDSVQASFHRLGIHLFNARSPGRTDGRSAPPSAADLAEFENTRAALTPAGPMLAGNPSDDGGGRRVPEGAFVLVDRLEALIHSLNPQTAVVLVFMPYRESALPKVGSHADQVLAQCKTRFNDVVRMRSKTFLIDRFVNDDIARDPKNFNDPTHVTVVFAKTVETDIARILIATH